MLLVEEVVVERPILDDGILHVRQLRHEVTRERPGGFAPWTHVLKM